MVHDNVRLDTALMLQKCDDFILLDLEHEVWPSAIAGKSIYWGSVFYNHMDPIVYKLAKKRQKVWKSINDNLKKKQKLDINNEKELLNTGVVLIINDKEREFFPENITTLNLKNKDTLLLFLDEGMKFNFLKSCKPLLNI